VTRSPRVQRLGQPLHTRREEPRTVRFDVHSDPASCYAQRRLGHRPGIGVDPQDERVRVGDDLGQDGAAVTRPEVDDDPAAPPGQVDDLPDVHLGDTPARDRTHPGSMPDLAHRTRRRGQAAPSTMRPSRSSTARSARSIRSGSCVAITAVRPSLRTMVRNSVMTDRPVAVSS